jgi:hypothetical protein
MLAARTARTASSSCVRAIATDCRFRASGSAHRTAFDRLVRSEYFALVVAANGRFAAQGVEQKRLLRLSHPTSK